MGQFLKKGNTIKLDPLKRNNEEMQVDRVWVVRGRCYKYRQMKREFPMQTEDFKGQRWAVYERDVS